MSSITIKVLFLFISYVNSCTWSPTQCGCPRTSPSIHHRIVGGSAAIPHSWPWIVSIRKYNSHICGAVLITKQYVLTAAHCFKNYVSSDLNYYSFALGHNGISERYFVSNAKRITLHSKYNTNGRIIHDIALVELNQTVNLQDPRVGFICLPYTHQNDNGAYPPIGTATWVAGWGTTRYEGESSPILLQVSVPITNNQGCQRRVTAPTKQICAGYDIGGKDSCQGDSGGPLVVEKGHGVFELVGIVSFGDECAKYMEPGIYTRISGYIDWIDDIIKPKELPIEKSTSTSTFSMNQLLPLIGSNVDCQQISYLIILIEILFLFFYIDFSK